MLIQTIAALREQGAALQDRCRSLDSELQYRIALAEEYKAQLDRAMQANRRKRKQLRLMQQQLDQQTHRRRIDISDVFDIGRVMLPLTLINPRLDVSCSDDGMRISALHMLTIKPSNK